jgi:hypothetical protein
MKISITLPNHEPLLLQQPLQQLQQKNRFTFMPDTTFHIYPHDSTNEDQVQLLYSLSFHSLLLLSPTMTINNDISTLLRALSSTTLDPTVFMNHWKPITPLGRKVHEYTTTPTTTTNGGEIVEIYRVLLG